MIDSSAAGIAAGLLLRRRAYNRLRRAERAGTVVRPERCQACGRKAPLAGHHEDYSRPLDITWLCSACHSARTRANRAAGAALIGNERSRLTLSPA